MKDIEDIYPLTPMQEAMLLHCVGNPESTALVTQIVFRLNRNIDLDLLQRCWDQVISRHSSLRTGFHWKSDKGPVQFVRKQSKLAVRFLELKPCESIDDEGQFKEILVSDMAETIDLTATPLMRVTCVSLSTGDTRMIWTSHHLILDRWCIPVLMEELREHYYQSNNENSTLHSFTEGPQQYKAYINFIGACCSAATESYWNKYLAEFNGNASLVSRDELKQYSAGEECSAHIDLSNTAGFIDLKRRSEASMATIAQLFWVFTVAKITRGNDVLFGVTVSGRPATIPGVERIIGCFINNVPCRSQIGPNTTIEKLLEKLSRDQIERENFQHVSLLQLNKSLYGRSGNLPMDTLFLWLQDIGKAAGPMDSRSDLLTMEKDSRVSASTFPLTLMLHETPDGLHVVLKKEPGYTTKISLISILNTYKEVLDQICSIGIDTVIGEVPYFQFDEIEDQNRADWRPEEELPSDNSSLLESRSQGRAPLDRAYVMQVLQKEWQRVLQLTEIDTNRSFFDQGGSSLDAAKIIGRLELMLRCSIPIIALYKRPYLNDMVDVIVDNDWSLKPDICLPVRETGTVLPLFCVASPDVNTIGFSQLASNLNDEIPVFVLQAPPESSTFRSLSPSELPQLAERYIEAMKTVQPAGPYNLFGMCSGSQLAFEMARILERKEEVCGLLGILNTWALFTVSQTYRLQQLYVRYRVLNEAPWQERPGIFWKRVIVRRILRPAKQRLQRAYPLITTTRNSAPATDASSSHNNDAKSENYQQTAPRKNSVEDPNELVDEWVHKYGWHRLYKPTSKLQQKITVFKLARQPFWRISSEALGWELHAESVEGKDLSCDDHDNLLREPWIAELANSIEECLLENENDNQN